MRGDRILRQEAVPGTELPTGGNVWLVRCACLHALTSDRVVAYAAANLDSPCILNSREDHVLVLAAARRLIARFFGSGDYHCAKWQVPDRS